MVFFLKVSRLTLFLLLYGLPIATFFLAPDPKFLRESVLGRTLAFGGFGITFIIYLLWLWSVGSYSFRTSAASLKNNGSFNIFKIAMAVISIAVVAIVSSLFLTIFEIDLPWLNATTLFSVVGGIAAILYISSFNAKYLKIRETGRAVKTEDYAQDIFLFLLYPVGLWTIQPRVRRIFGKL